MSCLNKLNIINPTNTFNKDFDQYYLDIPCGKCASCRRQLVNEWAIRAYAHAKGFKDRGGRVFLGLLTYRDSCMPMYNYGDIHIPCFSRKDIKTWKNSFARKVQRKLGFRPDLFVVSEYGDVYKRPHYHVLIYCQNGNYTTKELYNLFKDSWKFGFVFPKPYEVDGRFEVQGIAGLKYVCKYVAMDFSYLARKDVKRHLAYLASHESDSEEMHEEFNRFRRCLPFHTQPHGFGAYLLNEFNSIEDVEKLAKGFRYPLTTEVFQYPRYIINKLCYEYHEDGTRSLTEFGIAYKQYQLEKVRDAQVKRIRDYLLNLEHYRSVLPDKFKDGFDLYRYCVDYEYCLNFVSYRFLRNRCADYLDVHVDDYKNFLDYVYPIFLRKSSYKNSYYKLNRSSVKDLKSCIYSQIFEDFDLFLRDSSAIVDKMVLDAKIKRERESTKLRQMFNPI